ncbi:hypothetical protein FSW04_07275 [Baekduia soli]|uniref:Purine catabolism PurC-like domain-containing protein n=1 Tax=Baekduia soli TaxID=496014 RepID=A0A5B8U336_9ACTN|nr:PucR family transcriptional regulator ligand-binding domain-containing protein [Baekduia soli]QEC47403.1 hypothetical protein FSW04_07275 [Baekduia soli]
MDRLTLRDLLAQESLDLRLRTPETDAALATVVMGAHGTEALHPVPWMQKDWALLITGVRLVDRPDLQRALVGELADGGLAALGFGVGIDFETVPEALVDAAQERGFPVFEIPLRTPFREIIAFVNRSLLSTDLHTMRRLTSMREFLLDALQHPEAAETVVGRVGSLLDGTAVLFSRDGRAEHATGPLAPEGLWACVQAAERDAPVPEVGGVVPAVVPVRHGGRVQGWLVVAGRRTAASDRFTRPLVETAGIVLAGLAGLQHLTRDLERAAQAAFVDDLLALGEAEETIWAHRAAGLGLGLGATPLRGVVLVPAPAAAPGAAERLLTELEAALEPAPGLRAVLAVREGTVVGLVEGETEALAARLAELAGAGGPIAPRSAWAGPWPPWPPRARRCATPGPRPTWPAARDPAARPCAGSRTSTSSRGR